MTLEAVLACIHLLALLTMVVFLSSEAALCRTEWMNAAVVQRLARLDMIFGIAAVAVLATGLGLLSSLSLTCGLILENVTHTRQEARRLIYLGIPCSGLPGTVGASVGSQD